MIIKPGSILITEDDIVVRGFHFNFSDKHSTEQDIKEWIELRLYETNRWNGMGITQHKNQISVSCNDPKCDICNMWSDIKSLDGLRSKAAASGTGCIVVSIEDLNKVADEIKDHRG